MPPTTRCSSSAPSRREPSAWNGGGRQERATGVVWARAPHLATFYFRACGSRPTERGLIHTDSAD
jgi:hypothetical protein